MSQQTTVTVNGSILTPDSDALDYQPPVLTNGNTVGQSYSVALTTAPTTITLPAGTEFFGLRMPANNQVQVTLKGVSGDTGIAVHKLYGLPIVPIDSSQTTFVLVAASNVTVQLTTG